MHAAIPPGDSVRLTAWLFITPTDNTGAAFGLLRGYGPFLAAAALIVAVLVFVYGGKTGRSRLMSAALGLLLGGALGNLADRLVRGCVFDFIDLRFWPVFNLADCAITVGVGMLVVRILIREDAGRG